MHTDVVFAQARRAVLARASDGAEIVAAPFGADARRYVLRLRKRFSKGRSRRRFDNRVRVPHIGGDTALSRDHAYDGRRTLSRHKIRRHGDISAVFGQKASRARGARGRARRKARFDAFARARKIRARNSARCVGAQTKVCDGAPSCRR